MRQVTGRSQHLIVMLDLHMFNIRAQLAPQRIDQRQGRLITLLARSENDLMAAEQLRIGRFHPALLGAGNWVARHKSHRFTGKGQARSANHIAFGAAHIGEHRRTQVKLGQLCEQLFHGQDRHRQLDNIGSLTGGSQINLTAIDNPQLNRQPPRLWIEIDTYHFAAQAALTQTLGKRAANQAQADNHQAAELRGGRLHLSDSRFGFTHAFSTLARASRKRAFSAGRPIETRRKFGMP